MFSHPSVSAGASSPSKTNKMDFINNNMSTSFNSLILHDTDEDINNIITPNSSNANSNVNSNNSSSNNSMKRSSKYLNLSMSVSDIDSDYYSSDLNDNFQIQNFQNLHLQKATTPISKMNKFKRPHILISNSPSPSKASNNIKNSDLIDEESPSKFNLNLNLNFLKNSIIKKNTNHKLRKTLISNYENEIIKYKEYNDDDQSPSKTKKLKNLNFKKSYNSNINILNTPKSLPSTTPLKFNPDTFNYSSNKENDKPMTSNLSSSNPITNFNNFTPSSTISNNTPNSYKSVKPLQTAFTTTGLLKKNFMKTNQNILNSPIIPETPCKKNPFPDKIINNEELKNCISKFNNDFNNVDSIFKLPIEEPETPNKSNNLEYYSPPITNLDDHLISKFGKKNICFLGSGEYSVVFECSFQNYKYAIKRSKKKLIGNLEILNFTREIEILKNLNHDDDYEDEGKEYLINFIESWKYNDYYYIMSEFCENNNLEIFLKENKNIKLDEFRIWKILVEVSLGLNFIHKKNYIHLDLKPANIFITFEGSLKIGDFGLSTKLPVDKDFDLEGDRNYIAPELIENKVYTKSADIFSLGLIILEIATNIILPENGTPWRKLRSGDLSDAGKLSCDNINEYLNHISLNSSSTNSNSNCNSISDLITNTTLQSSQSSIFNSNRIEKLRLIPNWVPFFLINNSGNLDKLVNKMLKPNPMERISANDILKLDECVLIENRRKAGALIFEGEFGPRPDDE